jgi:hypothetical protein
MKKMTKRGKVQWSIIAGVVFGITGWLLDFIPFFRGSLVMWWNYVIDGCVYAVLMYFVIIPIIEKAGARKEQKLCEQQNLGK